jgi:hypothetical protein
MRGDATPSLRYLLPAPVPLPDVPLDEPVPAPLVPAPVVPAPVVPLLLTLPLSLLPPPLLLGVVDGRVPAAGGTVDIPELVLLGL